MEATKFTREDAVAKLTELGFTWSVAGCEFVHTDGRRGRLARTPDESRWWLMTPARGEIEVLG